MSKSLYDRISTRPFLTPIEKKWITFQLLCALEQCQGVGVVHGDLKCENVLMTTWNWVLISDFAPFKPAYLPSDNPADFSFFFDAGQRRRCYLAPERFYDPGSPPPAGPVTPTMDVFSMGCVIAEIFLEGESIFGLSELLSYRSGELDIGPVLARIEDPSVRKLVAHMIQRDPALRLKPSEYLQEWEGRLFPSYFRGFLHGFMAQLMPLNCDDKIQIIRASYDDICKSVCAPLALAESEDALERKYREMASGLASPEKRRSQSMGGDGGEPTGSFAQQVGGNACMHACMHIHVYVYVYVYV
jgi:phosphoinositide-3-kinase regulatory subunit 4